MAVCSLDMLLYLNGWLTAMISHDALGSVLEPRQTQHLICFAFLSKVIANCDFDSIDQVLVETLAYHYALVGQRTNGFSNYRGLLHINCFACVYG